MPDPAIDTDTDCDSSGASPAAALDALTPEVARDIDGLLRSHAAPHDALYAPTVGGPGALIAAPLIRLILARLLPVIGAQALSLLDAEVAKLQGQYPTLDLSFVHGLVANVFAAVEGSFPASGPVPGP